MSAAASADAYLERRRALIEQAVPGAEAALALSDLTDEAVSTLAEAASSALSRPFAVFALGGYGARRLLPHSDIDLLIVTESPRAETAAFVKALLYPLWDTRVKVGHQVRTPKEQARAVLAEDLDVLTSFLTARLVTGDEAIAARTVEAVFRRLSRTKRRVLRAIEARERPGSPYLLEPDLKEGCGGQRDLDELVWRSALEAGAPRQECGSLAEEQAAITRARWIVHLASSRGSNLLTLDAAEALDADELQRALETVHHTLLDMRDQAAGGERSRPSGALDVDSLARLAAAPRGVEALERLAHAGGLDAAIPGFGALMTLRRPALTHRYTVGAHAIRTLCFAVAEPDFGDLREPMRHALVVAALAHDLGKRTPGPGHAVRGALEVPGIAARLGLSDGPAETAQTLVREHLLLSEVATTRDLGDEDLVLATAARLGRADLVAPLFQLTMADTRATDPEAWTPWRAALVAELAGKLEAALGGDTEGAGIVAAAEATRAEALRSASSVGAPRSVLGFLEGAPLRYLARRGADEVIRDARLVQSLAGPGLLGEVAVSVRPGPLPGTWQVDVVTRDRAGLFALVTGALALVGLSALSAEAFTDRTGIALDTFTVASATLAQVEPETWNRLERALYSAIRDPLALDARVAERRKHYPARGAGGVRTEVTIVHRGPFTAGVRVRTADRVALLHDLARAFERAGLDIRRATITTTGAVANDTFEVTDPAGDAPDAELLAQTLLPLLFSAAAHEEGGPGGPPAK